MIKQNLTKKSPAAGYAEKGTAALNVLSIIFWLAFFTTLAAIILHTLSRRVWQTGSVFQISGLTLIVWATVFFFAAVIGRYSAAYLHGFKYSGRFTGTFVGFIASVCVFAASKNMLLMLFSWFVMGLFMAQLIGVKADWKDAREAAKLARKYFLAGTALFSAAVIQIWFTVGTLDINQLADLIPEMPETALIFSGSCIVLAALIQSSIFPFHKWLLSAMTAPTPASALMHAGFVNGSGILLTLFAALMTASGSLMPLFIIGGITAVCAQFVKLIQTSVKQKLACSTIAQMGFMLMQCGLGFFNAAIVHLILHGFYKAYLFLSAGENVHKRVPQAAPVIKINTLQIVPVLLSGLLGGWLFSWLTGKNMLSGSDVFLVLVAAVTSGQLTYNIVKQNHFTILQKAFMPPVLFCGSIVLYALFYSAVGEAMWDVPLIHYSEPLSAAHIFFGLLFLFGFFIMKLGIYRKIPWLYVKLLNSAQPDLSTLLNAKK